jgi:hypothetical protein
MKKVWWVVRIAVIVAASYCIFAPSGAYTFRSVQAQVDAAKCDTGINCGRNSENNCYCSSVVIGEPGGCTGCFVPNGSSSCGSCSSGPNGNN